MRALRKIQKANEANDQETQVPEEQEKISSRSINKFAFLDDEEQDENDDTENEQPDNEELREQKEENTSTKKEVKKAPKKAPKKTVKKEPSGTSKRRKGKKDKKEAIKDKKSNKDNEQDDMDSFMKEIEKFSEKVAANESSAPARKPLPNQADPTKKLLSISPINLDPSKEFHSVIDSTSTAYPTRRPHVPSAERRAAGSAGSVVCWRAGWAPPSTTMALAMQKYDGEKDSDDDVEYFYYTGNKRYEKADRLFREACRLNDIEYYRDVLEVFPYHPQTLNQLALIAKLSGDQASYEDFLCRSLFCFQNGFHHDFRLNGRCRLLFEDSKTKPFFYTIFRYMQLVNKKGCPRTALEFCKLLISFDPSDPLNAILLMDCYALRAAEYTYLLNFFNEFEYRGLPLLTLPGMAFGAALAARTAHLGGTLEDVSKDSLLRSALLSFPQFVIALSSAAASPRLTALVASGGLFEKERIFSDALDRVINICIEHCLPLWTRPPALATHAKGAPKAQSSPIDWLCDTIEEVNKYVETEEGKVDYANAQAIVSTRFPPQDPETGKYSEERPEFIDVIPEDFSDRTDAIPHELLQGERNPPEEVRRATTDNPFLLFLTSLFPWVDVPNAPYAPRGEGEGNHDDEDEDSDLE